jgi:polysaccharide biosynthesis PFTS motif protein
MTKKSLNEKVGKNLDFPDNLKQLLFKKVLASNLKNFEKNTFSLNSKNIISLDPKILTKFKMSFRKKTIIVLFCAFLLICYTLKTFSVRKYSEDKHLTIFFSLTKEQIYRKGKLDPIYEFINADRFGINKQNRIWVENKSTSLRHKHKNLEVVFDVYLSLFSRQINFSKRAKILVTIYANLFKFLRFFNEYDANFLVIKEYIFDNAVIKYIDTHRIEKIITTPSHLMFQPLIFEMKNFRKKRFMLWYSSNAIPLEYKNSKAVRYKIPKDIYRYMEIDQHWVWNKEHSNYLTNTLKVQSCVKGPMLFYVPSKFAPTLPSIDVLIFDVTPASNPNIHQGSIFNSRDLKKFIIEITNACLFLEDKYKIKLSVFLKPKRPYVTTHDHNYLNFLKDLELAGRLNILRSDENLYDIINISRIVIGYPCVSPVIIGREQRVNSFFYSSSKLLKLAPKNYASFFIQNPRELQLELEKVLTL